MSQSSDTSECEYDKVTQEDIHKIADYLSGKYSGGSLEREEVFQATYLVGLEALKEDKSVFSHMKNTAHFLSISKDSPVKLPNNPLVKSVIKKLREGTAPETPTERRVVASMGSNREDVLPITLVTYDTPERLLGHKQEIERLKALLDCSSLYLTKRERDAIGVCFFGEPLPEEFMLKHNVSQRSLFRDREKALGKLRKMMFHKEEDD